jgi:hypothetical protein
MDNQRNEMMRYGLDFGGELLGAIRNIPTQYEQGERLADAKWLEKELAEARTLLNERGESNPQTVLQMQILVKLNGILCKRYSTQLNLENLGFLTDLKFDDQNFKHSESGRK